MVLQIQLAGYMMRKLPQLAAIEMWMRIQGEI